MSAPTTHRRIRNVAVAALVLLSATVGSLALASAPASAGSGADFVSLINGLRSSRGLAPLAIDGPLQASAQAWTNTMASTNTLAHDPGLGSAVSGWTRIGENVGSGGSVTSLWNSFVASPTHLDNILNPAYTHIGVGYLQDSNGVIWTAHRFMARAGSTTPPPTAPPTAPPPTAPPAPAPIVTAPPAPAPTVAATSTPVSSSGAGSSGAGSTAGSSVSGANGAAGSGDSQRLRPDPPADPERVAEVIDALRALPA
jgi:uncharacterized protein YkwD